MSKEKKAEKIILEKKMKFKAAKGVVLPVYVDGKIMHITEDEKGIEIDVDLCPYETKANIKKAIKQKQIMGVK